MPPAPSGRRPSSAARLRTSVEVSSLAEVHLSLAAELGRLADGAVIVHHIATRGLGGLVTGAIRQASLKFVVRRQTLRWRLRFAGEPCLPPLVLERYHIPFGKRGQRLRDPAVELLQLALLLRGRQFKHWHGVSGLAIEAAFRNGVEERRKAIELFLLDGVVLVVMAAGASHG